MKFLLENWRKFLIKEKNDKFPYQIYCDMDGVLVDFETAAIEQINKDLKDKAISGKTINRLRKKLSDLGRNLITQKDLNKMDKKNRLQSARNYMYARFENDEEFWANLPWASGGKELWAYISQFNPYILTTPMQDAGSKTGKKLWIKNNLQPKPNKIFMSHKKYKWATTNGKPNILIDDFTTNTIPWKDSGGIAILHTNTNKTIKELKELVINGD